MTFQPLSIGFRVKIFLTGLLIFGSMLLSQVVTSVNAQAPNDNGSPLGMSPGAPEGSYALSGFESVNLYNGSLSFSFPVHNIGGRGAAGYSPQVPIDLKWMVTKNEWYDEFQHIQYTWYVPSVAEFYGYDYGPGMVSVRYSQWRPEGCNIGGEQYTTYRWAAASVVFKAPDGTEHELVDAATMGRLATFCKQNGVWPFIAANRIHVVPPCNIALDDAHSGLDVIDQALALLD